MKMLRVIKIMSASIVAMSALLSSQATLASPKVTLVQELHRNETSTGLAVSGNYIFSGVSRMVEGESHHIAVYNIGDLSLKTTMDLPHTVLQILPLSDSSILVLGLVSVPHTESKISEISWATGKFVIKTKTVPMDLIPERMDGGSGKLFFAEPASAAVYFWNGSSMSPFKGTISGPGATASAGDSVWVLARGNLFRMGDERISVGSLASKTISNSSVSLDDTIGLVDLKPVANSKFIIGTNILKQKVVTFNPQSQQKVGELEIEHTPSASAIFGSCAATIDRELKTIVVSKVQDNGSITHVTTLDMSESGDRLKDPKTLFFDGLHKQILVKSAYPRPSCSVSQSSLFSYVDMESTWWDECN